MAATLTYTVFSLGEAQLHQLHAKEGKLFVMGEVAVELFQESPTAFLQELRKGKFNRLISSARDVLHTIAELQLPVESSASMTGVTLLPSATVEGLLVEKRKLELVQPFKLALLKLASQTQDGLVAEQSAPAELPVGRLQLMEVVDMLLDIGRVRLSLHGSGHSSVADAHFVTALALVQLEERERASEQLEAAAAIYAQAPSPQQTRLVEMARIMLNVI